jgi:hypothetical protein
VFSSCISLDLGLYSAGNYRTGHLPRRGLVDFTISQISPITLWSEIDQKPTTKAIYTVLLSSSYYIDYKNILWLNYKFYFVVIFWLILTFRNIIIVLLQIYDKKPDFLNVYTNKNGKFIL